MNLPAPIVTKIYFLDVEVGMPEYAGLIQLVSDGKAARLARFHRFEDSQRSLLGDVLARYAISLKSGIQNNGLIFETNEYGKPLLKGSRAVHFNISHSGNWVVCALDDAPVGIDVEETGSIDLKIAEKFFSKDEYASLTSVPVGMQEDCFYKIWTLKESYIKAQGRGLSIPLDSFSISETSKGLQAITENGVCSYKFFQSVPSKGVVYAVCTMSNQISSTTTFDIEGFMSELIRHFHIL